MNSTTVSAERKNHRQRLFEGMALSLAHKNYAETTIADIVREAGVSRRTFYEHFDSQAECLIALYEAASHNALKVLRAAIDPGHAWQVQVERAMAAYLDCLASNPLLMRTLYVEILALGASGLAARRRVNDEVVDFMLTVINAKPQRPVLSRDMALAVVGGVNELVLLAIEQDTVQDLPRIAATVSRLVQAVTRQVEREKSA
ncbi:MAG: TetR/AcrR family transcriptional regulator [Gammaproteobacteria bacterium]|nr:TetR/AcrR family transcriptional regulator [Gammaproteobacteria bacterium]MBU0786048.1 TetR/AcrR family transcriptional regulator [Gammaproteobacteria bacterium]MBU0814363.1 TetR/AcrR family transcriptional regulator [Gammaproteobacteria bacterium]MBU1786792.1 TetR/AcrR family transcriptional regulator [Gammaproteobacteria bacterium]